MPPILESCRAQMFSVFSVIEQSSHGQNVLFSFIALWCNLKQWSKSNTGVRSLKRDQDFNKNKGWTLVHEHELVVRFE